MKKLYVLSTFVSTNIAIACTCQKIAVQTNIKMLVIHLRNCIKFYNVRRKWYMWKKSLIAGNKNFELEVWVKNTI